MLEEAAAVRVRGQKSKVLLRDTLSGIGWSCLM
jgi:hypothetical protein